MIVSAKRKKPPKILDIEAVGQAVLDHIERVGPRLHGATQARHADHAAAPADGISATRSSADPLARRKHVVGTEASWTKRGMFRAGFNAGQPRLKTAKLFTKGKER